jgi:uncharacterized membrane protein YeaQ/YmgE (transglycosylase-associated protein family)
MGGWSIADTTYAVRPRPSFLMGCLSSGFACQARTAPYNYDQLIADSRSMESPMKPDVQALVIMAAIGIVAGYLASIIVGGSGLLRYLILGIIGSFVGGMVLGNLGINLGIKNRLASQIATSTIGAIVVALLARLIA